MVRLELFKSQPVYLTCEELFQMAKCAMKPQIDEDNLKCPYCGSEVCGIEEAWLDGAVQCFCYDCDQIWAIEPTTRDPEYMEMFSVE